MNTAETCALLDAAEEHLSEATNRLLALGDGSGDYGSSIQQAAEVLQEIQRGWDAPVKPSVGPRLMALAARTATVEHLMDSAATLYMGRLAANTSVDLGYGADGAMDRCSEQRSLVVNG